MKPTEQMQIIMWALAVITIANFAFGVLVRVF